MVHYMERYSGGFQKWEIDTLVDTIRATMIA